MIDQVSESPDAIASETRQFRSQIGHISRQSGIFFAGTIFTTALGYFFKVYLARILGAEDLGLYALGATLIGFLGIFNALGLPQAALRFVAAYLAAGKFKELHALLWRGAGLLLGANVVLAVVMLLLGPFVALRFYHSPALVRYLPLFALLMVFGVMATFYGKVLAGYRDIKVRTVIMNFVTNPLSMLIAIVVISGGMGLRGYIMAQVVSMAIACVLLLIAVRRFTPAEAQFSSQPGSSPERKVWSFSAAMFGIGFLQFLVAQVDRVALGVYRNAREVGIYSVAAAMVGYVPVFLNSLNQIFAPTISDLHTRREHALVARLFQSLTKWVIALSLPLALVTIVFARPLMRIFGHDFEAGWPILIIGTIGQLVNCGVGSVGYLLLMSGNEKRVMKVEIVMTTVMVISSAILVPVWGIVGAALASAITNVGMNAWNLLEVRKALQISPYNHGYRGLALPTAATLVVTLAAKNYAFAFHHDWLAVGIALGLAYSVFTGIFVKSALDADDRLIATAVWSRVRAAVVRAGVEA